MQLSPIQHSLATLVQCIEKNDLAAAVSSLKLIVEEKRKIKKIKTVAKSFNHNKIIGSMQQNSWTKEI